MDDPLPGSISINFGINLFHLGTNFGILGTNFGKILAIMPMVTNITFRVKLKQSYFETLRVFESSDSWIPICLHK